MKQIPKINPQWHYLRDGELRKVSLLVLLKDQYIYDEKMRNDSISSIFPQTPLSSTLFRLGVVLPAAVGEVFGNCSVLERGRTSGDSGVSGMSEGVVAMAPGSG